MAEFGITPEALADSIQHDLSQRPLYRDARGNEWNGQGEMPDWLRVAKNAGVGPDFFRIEPTPQTASTGNKLDPRQLDLFR
jgi:DNA-binding protein H-NS